MRGFFTLAIMAAFSGAAYAEPPSYVGIYTGSVMCESGLQNLTLSIEDRGPLMKAQFQDPCRSGSGPCNDAYKWRHDNSNNVHAYVQYFPSVANPDTPRRSGWMTGTVAKFAGVEETILPKYVDRRDGVEFDIRLRDADETAFGLDRLPDIVFHLGQTKNNMYLDGHGSDCDLSAIERVDIPR